MFFLVHLKPFHLCNLLFNFWSILALVTLAYVAWPDQLFFSLAAASLCTQPDCLVQQCLGWKLTSWSTTLREQAVAVHTVLPKRGKEVDSTEDWLTSVFLQLIQTTWFTSVEFFPDLHKICLCLKKKEARLGWKEQHFLRFWGMVYETVFFMVFLGSRSLFFNGERTIFKIV